LLFSSLPEEENDERERKRKKERSLAHKIFKDSRTPTDYDTWVRRKSSFGLSLAK